MDAPKTQDSSLTGPNQTVIAFEALGDVAWPVLPFTVSAVGGDGEWDWEAEKREASYRIKSNNCWVGLARRSCLVVYKKTLTNLLDPDLPTAPSPI